MKKCGFDDRRIQYNKPIILEEAKPGKESDMF